MSRLFIYYSNTGNGDFVANVMAAKGFNLLKIEPEKDLPKNFVLKILVGGFSALIKERVKIKNSLNMVRNYDEIYVGTPVWNGRVSSPINTVLDELKYKRFNLICYSGSGKIRALKRQVKNYQIENIISLIEPLKNQDDTVRLLNKYV